MGTTEVTVPMLTGTIEQSQISTSGITILLMAIGPILITIIRITETMDMILSLSMMTMFLHIHEAAIIIIFTITILMTPMIMIPTIRMIITLIQVGPTIGISR